MTVIGVATLVLYDLSSDDLDVVYYTYTSEKVPASFEGYKMAQLTDLHNHPMEYGNRNLLDAIDLVSPDAVFLTGDFIDRNTKNLDVQTELLAGLTSYPVYFVNGNHEITSKKRAAFDTLRDAYGVIDLNSKMNIITRGTESIYFIGVNDADLQQAFYWNYRNTGIIKEKIETLTASLAPTDLEILLAHRPDLYQDYIDTGMDLVFSGHYHGGQIRIIGKAISDFYKPWYSQGMTEIDGTTFVTSTGLGYSVAPIRVNCNAQLVVVTLHNPTL
ncbi:MAG: metallophosphoesterase [Firmicutes bacterium]|nr:metallophosphoesterase [Bacillota bacterium]